MELKRARPEFASSSAELDESPYLTDFLDRFYMARIGVRMLIQQHCALHERVDGFVGIIDGTCDSHRVVKNALEDASSICRQHYGVAPEVRLLGNPQLTFRYVPEHLHYIVRAFYRDFRVWNIPLTVTCASPFSERVGRVVATSRCLSYSRTQCGRWSRKMRKTSQTFHPLMLSWRMAFVTLPSKFRTKAVASRGRT
jgi:hypothetical protein